MNWDQTVIIIILSSSWTLEEKGSKRIMLVGIKISIKSRLFFVAPYEVTFYQYSYVIYKGTTVRCHPKHKFPPGWDITHSKKHWSNEHTMIQYIQNVIIPYVDNIRTDSTEAALIIMDNFKGQTTPTVSNLLEENNIQVCLLPPNTTDRLQPLDVAINKPAKEFYRRKFQGWYFQRSFLAN